MNINLQTHIKSLTVLESRVCSLVERREVKKCAKQLAWNLNLKDPIVSMLLQTRKKILMLLQQL
jgi:hypothetical protein